MDLVLFYNSGTFDALRVFAQHSGTFYTLGVFAQHSGPFDTIWSSIRNGMLRIMIDFDIKNIFQRNFLFKHGFTFKR